MTDAVPSAQIPTRPLTVVARKQPLIATSWVAPDVLLDGHRFPLVWGSNLLTIPADRPVHVQCEMPFIFTYGTASTVTQPNQPAALEYSPPASQWFRGELGPIGSTRTRGTWLIWAALGVLGGVVVLGIAVAVLLVSLS